MTEPQTITRNADLNSLVQILRSQHARRLDLVVPVAQIRAENGRLVIQGAEPVLDEDGVTSADGTYLPTAICDGGIADRLGIPPGYLTKLRHQATQLWDQNVNGWLGHVAHEGKKFLVRCFRNADGTTGVGRAFLSDSYKPIENLDVLMTVLDGLKDVGIPVDIDACDLTDRRMYVRVRCEAVAVNAAALVANYRSPFNGKSGADLPMMFAGFEVTNSEVGHGAFSIAPRVILQVCKNGMTSRADAVRSQHLGGKLEAGEIVWSDETQEKNLALIRSKTADAVRQFLSVEWLEKHLATLTAQAGIEVTKPTEVIEHVSKTLRYTEAQQDDILAMFIKGGDLTAGGVMHAVTASAQNQTDADLAADMEADAARVLTLAAGFRG